MANISLNSPIFNTPPVATGQKPMSRNLWAQKALSVTSSGGLEMLQQAAHDRRRGAVGISKDDAVLISSDDESDYDDFPPIEELLLRAKRSVAGMGFNAISGGGGNSDAKESVALGANRDDKPASSQQQTQNLEPSPEPPPTLALLRRSSESPGALQAEQDRPVPPDGYM
ncbi:hypothetical protein HD806DRAFT_551422 [Xylariaceae sp. AK1471]|nr:hypothetical protein HD806DRAFT_551422 [Xylariaceae sp. AK1471]